MKKCRHCGLINLHSAKRCDCGYDFQSKATPSKELNPQIRPWVRYWTRYIDLTLFSIVCGIIITIYNPPLLKARYSVFILTMLVIFAWIYVESILLASWGTTPGKWLLRTTLINSLGEKLNYNEASKRSFMVWLTGIGTGFPLLAIVTLLISYDKLTKNGITSWDKNGNFTISHKNIGMPMVIIAIILLATIIYLYFRSKMH